MEEQIENMAVPDRGTTYYYLRGVMSYPQGFRICETSWRGGMSDIMRLANGNYFPTVREADDMMDMLNGRFSKLCGLCGHQQIMQHLEDILKKKRKDKDFEKGLHPDILD